MDAREWLTKNNIDLRKYHGNIGDLEGHICIENMYEDGWVYYSNETGWQKVPEDLWR